MDARIRTALTLYAFGVLGLFLLVAPWTPVWSRATLVLIPTSWGTWVMSGWLRGTVSALGALDLLMALQVAREFWQKMKE